MLFPPQVYIYNISGNGKNIFTTNKSGLTLRQNKYVFRGKGHHKNSATTQFILSTRY